MTTLSQAARAMLVSGALALLSTAAFAGKAEQACAPDIQAYCAGIPQGGGKIAQCLRSHQQQLSPNCQQAMTAAAALMKEVAQACEDDIHQYCAGAAPGTARDCLKTNFLKLSFGCKKELFEAKRAM
jgi:cysteine rich repeat protein